MAKAEKPVTGYNVTHIKADDIDTGLSFQRSPDFPRIQHIAAEWDWRLFRPLTIARDGRDWLVDGQHTFRAMEHIVNTDPKRAKKLSIDLDAIPATIIPVKDVQRAAGMFVLLNTSQESLTAIEIYRGELVMEDPVALAIDAKTNALGLTVGEKQGIEHVAAITALKHLENVGHLDFVLDVATTAWPYKHGDPVNPAIQKRTEGSILRALSLYAKKRTVMGDTVTDREVIDLIAKKKVKVGGVSQDITPLSITASAQEMGMLSMVSGGLRISSGNMAEWMAHAIGRALHGKKTWVTKYGGR